MVRGGGDPAAIDPADPVSHALAVGGEEPEPISPELVLVCAELRRRALAALPDRDPDGFVPRPAPLRTVPDSVLMPARPDPSPVPEADAAPIQVAAGPAPVLPSAAVLSPTKAGGDAEAPRGVHAMRQLAIAAAAYLALEGARIAVYGMLAMAALAVLVTLATLR